MLSRDAVRPDRMLSALRTPEKGKDDERGPETRGDGGTQEQQQDPVPAPEPLLVKTSVLGVGGASATTTEGEAGTSSSTHHSSVHSGYEESHLVLFKGDQLRTSAHYRSSDPIQNLRVRVRYRFLRGPTSLSAPVEAAGHAEAREDAARTSEPDNDKPTLSEAGYDLGDEDGEEKDVGEPEVQDSKWTVRDVSWQQKIYDRETVAAARTNTQALEKHLWKVFKVRGGGRSPPEQKKRFQKVFQKYREDIASIGTGSRGAAMASEKEGGLVDSDVYTFVHHEDAVRQIIADEVGEIAQEAITTESTVQQPSDCGLVSACNLILPVGCGTRRRDHLEGSPDHSSGRHLGVGSYSRSRGTRESGEGAQSMTIVAGVNGEQIVLAQIRSFQSEILEIRPGFSDSSSKSTVFFAETPRGALIEYTLENSSAPISSKSDIAKTVFGLAALSHKERMRRVSGAQALAPAATATATARKISDLGGPFASLGDRYGGAKTASQLNLNLEIVSGKDFRRDALYVEYFIYFPKAKASAPAQTPHDQSAGAQSEDLWHIEEEARNGVQGVTQVSSGTRYPTTSLMETGRHADRVVNWCYPVELDMTASKDASGLEDTEWPIAVFTIYSYDKWDRSTCEGFCRLPLNRDCLGSKCHYLTCWKPQGSLKQRMKESFTGGIIQPQDMHGLYDFLITQKLKSPMVTSCEGILKVRTNVVLQTQQTENVRVSRNLTRSLNFTPSGPKTRTPKKQSKASRAKPGKVPSHTLMEITERARERIAVLREKNNKLN